VQCCEVSFPFSYCYISYIYISLFVRFTVQKYINGYLFTQFLFKTADEILMKCGILIWTKSYEKFDCGSDQSNINALENKLNIKRLSLKHSLCTKCLKNISIFY